MERLACIDAIIPYGFSGNCLDVGCGSGTMALKARGKGYEYVGLEVERSLIKKGPFVQGDARYLPFASGSFQLVIATEIIEHLENGEHLLLEIKRVLKDKGCLIVSTPNRFSPEGVKGKIYEIISRKRWKAWDKDHKHVFFSCEFLSLVKRYFDIITIYGYYYLPKIPMTNKIETKWWFGRNLRFQRSGRRGLNMLGFQIIVLLEKCACL